MAMVIVHLSPELDRLVGVIKGIYGLSSKDKAIQFVLEKQGEELLEGELRPEFVKGFLADVKKAKYREFKSIKELKARIEHA